MQPSHSCLAYGPGPATSWLAAGIKGAQRCELLQRAPSMDLTNKTGVQPSRQSFWS